MSSYARTLLLPSITFLCSLFIFSTSILAIDPLAVEFGTLPCIPSSNANLTISGGSPNLPLELSTFSMWAGAVGSLKINNKETVANTDPGLDLQYAFQSGGLGEGDNPTEGGSAGIFPSSSVFIEGCSNGKTLYTKSQMAYWYPVNGTILSPFIMSKTITIGAKNIPNLIRFVVKIHSPTASKGWQLETPCGHHTADFNQFSEYNYSTHNFHTLLDNQLDSTSLTGSLIYMSQNLLRMSNGSVSLVPYIPHPTDNFKYYVGKGLTYPITKWDILTYRPADPNPGDYYYESYLLVSPNSSVTQDVASMLSSIPPQIPNRDPVGWIDTVSVPPSGIVSGWAADPDLGDEFIRVDFYLDKPGDQANAVGSTYANKLRTDVLSSTGFGKYSGFEYQIPLNKIQDGKAHTLYAYGINKNKQGIAEGSSILIQPQSGIPVPIFVPVLLSGDLNKDGKVDLYDYTELVRGYGTIYTDDDFINVLANYGK